MKSTNKTPVAAFDFDRTITYRDSTLPFLIFTSGYLKTFYYLALNLPTLLKFVLGMASRQEVKERIFTTFFYGKSYSNMCELGMAFAKEILPKHVRPEALRRIAWHREQGHRCLLISASVTLYLEPWAKEHGFHDVLCSRLAVDNTGKVSGKLQGLNCRGPEKVRRLEECIGPLENNLIYAYGDSEGDKELLEIADYPFYRALSSD